MSALISRPPTVTVRGPASLPVPASTSIPSAASLAATSADCAPARSRTRAYSPGASTAAAASSRMPSPADLSSAAIRPDVAISVFDGTQSLSTHAPPRPSRSTTVTSAPTCAATRAASYPPGPPPRMTTFARGWLTLPLCSLPHRLPHASRFHGGSRPRPAAHARTLRARGAVCRVRQQHEPGADGRTLPALAPAGHRLAGGVAAHLRRRGHRLGRRARHRGRGRRRARVRRALRAVRKR